MVNRFLLTTYLLTFAFWLTAQEPLKHERKIYVSPENKVYVNKAQPVYFRVSLSPDANAPSCVLPSEQTPKYANPMYFDAEGLNTLRSPYAVDPVTKRIVDPKRDVLFDVYADGMPPSTRIKFTSCVKHLRNGVTYYGKGLKTDLTAKDETSGVEGTFVSINKSVYQDVSNMPMSYNEEKEYLIAYYSVDHVGNVETPKFEKFYVDLTPPVTTFQIIGESKGRVLSAKASISLSSKDSLSGVSKILYAINDGPEKIYTAPIPLAVLKDGKSKINYYAIDNVGNKEESRIISASTDAIEEKTDLSTFSFYIDKEAPVISSEIVGSQHKGKYLYIAKDSRIKINAVDEKSGVAKIMYSIDNPLLRGLYNEPFLLQGDGLHTVYYAAVDNVGNVALAQSKQVYIDDHIPSSKVTFIGKQFVNRDTLFVTSDTKINIITSETGSGIQSVDYTLDGIKATFTGSFVVDKEGYHTLEYGAKDNVNNSEAEKKCSFFIDNRAPVIFYKFSTKAIGEKTVRDQKFTIYPSNVMLYVAATDNAAGVERLLYRINGKEPQTIIPLKDFQPGNYEIEIIATDMLKNKSTQMVRFSLED
jgi:hypothetical protein